MITIKRKDNGCAVALMIIAILVVLAATGVWIAGVVARSLGGTAIAEYEARAAEAHAYEEEWRARPEIVENNWEGINDSALTVGAVSMNHQMLTILGELVLADKRKEDEERRASLFGKFFPGVVISIGIAISIPIAVHKRL